MTRLDCSAAVEPPLGYARWMYPSAGPHATPERGSTTVLSHGSRAPCGSSHRAKSTLPYWRVTTRIQSVVLCGGSTAYTNA